MAKCPEPLNTTLDTIGGHREALGLGRKEPHTHMHWSHIHTFNTNTHMLCKHSYTCSYTLENATYYTNTHIHGSKHTLTAAQRHKAGITMAGREGQTCIQAPMGFKGIYTHCIYTYTGIYTKTHKKGPTS